jgi:myo-inositol-1(or 4)-monophosphatase
MKSEKTREILHRALLTGGELLLQYEGTILETRIKESISSVVTDADLASEKLILEILSETGFPCNTISEESGFTDRESIFTWVVDPLDGTSNFAAGLPWFGIIITLFREREPVLAGMYLPADKQLYLAGAGKGAWRNAQPIHSARSVHLEEQLISYSFDYSAVPGKTSREMGQMEHLIGNIRNIRSTNSLVDFCYVADGRLGAAINQTTKIWDIAAAALIITETGGKVTDVEGHPINFDLSPQNFEKNYTIVAAGANMHHRLIDILSQSIYKNDET